MNEKGLTLIELMVVIVLLGLIFTVVGKNVMKTGATATAKLNVVRMEKIKEALGLYRLEYNSYPSQLGELVSASADVKNSGKLFTPLLDQSELKDVWGNEFLYRVENNGRTFALSSYGQDGATGGEGPDQDVTMRP